MLDSIQCNHQQLAVAKTAIVLSDDSKHNDFELAVDFLLLKAKSFKSEKTQNDWNVSVLKQANGSEGIIKKEYEKLSKDQKAELHQLRKEKGDNGNGGSDQTRTISALHS